MQAKNQEGVVVTSETSSCTCRNNCETGSDHAGVGLRQSRRLFSRNRIAGEEVALRHVTAVTPQKCQLLLGCHPLGDDLKAKIVGQHDNRSADCLVLGVQTDTVDYGSVDFQPVHRILLQLRQARVACPKFVDSYTNSQRLEPLDGLHRRTRVLGKHALLQVQFQVLRREIGRPQHPFDERDQAGLSELDWGYIDRYGKRRLLGQQRLDALACRLQHPFANRNYEPQLLAQRNELLWQQNSACRVIPANKCLGPGRPARRDVYLRLVAQTEFLSLNGAAQFRGKRLTLGTPRIEIRREVLEVVATLLLCTVHRLVRVAQDCVRIGRIQRIDAYARAAGKNQFGAGRVYRSRNCRQCPVHELGYDVDVVQVGEQQHEFVAAKTHNGIRGSDRLRQACRHRFEHLVPDFVAEVVIDGLEVVQVDKGNRHHLVVTTRRCNRMTQPVLERIAVRQAGQGVVRCLVLQFRLIALALAYVARKDQDRVVPMEGYRRGGQLDMDDGTVQPDMFLLDGRMLLHLILQASKACRRRTKRVLMHEIDVLLADQLPMMICTVQLEGGFVGKGDDPARDGQNRVRRQLHQVLIPLLGFTKRLLGRAAPSALFGLRKRLFYGRADPPKVVLVDVIRGTEFKRVYGALFADRAGDEYEGGVGERLPGETQRRETVELRESVIADDQRWFFFAERANIVGLCLDPVDREVNPGLAKFPLKQSGVGVVVLQQQNYAFVH